MLDPKLLRDHLQEIAARLAKRGYVLNVGLLEELENTRKVLQTHTQELQNNRNIFAKQIGQKKSKGENAAELIAAAEANNQQLISKEEELQKLQEQLQHFYLDIPNLPHDSIPYGVGEQDNVEIRR
jgi:seryl-tRNA synthetase